MDERWTYWKARRERCAFGAWTTCNGVKQSARSGVRPRRPRRAPAVGAAPVEASGDVDPLVLLRQLDADWRAPSVDLDEPDDPDDLDAEGGWLDFDDLDDDTQAVLSGEATVPGAVKSPAKRGGSVRTEERRAPGLPASGSWKVVHLGTSSAIPTKKRNVSSLALLVSRGPGEDPLLFVQDAGEGTANRLVDANWCGARGLSWIQYIFVTHVHGDHIYGLPRVLQAIGAQHLAAAEAAGAPRPPERVVQIFAPYGVRSFLRTAAHMMPHIGVRFSVRELVPRADDFGHLGRRDMWRPNTEELFDKEERSAGLNARSWSPQREGVPPPHPEEVRMDDVYASEDGTWELVADRGVRVTAVPLTHRVPCFGYVYTEAAQEAAPTTAAAAAPETLEIDVERARALGVRGRQYAVLRSGRPVTIKSTGLEVRPEDVRASATPAPAPATGPSRAGGRKVVVLGDTCESSAAEDAARGADVIVHEATFTNKLADKAKIAMHSTAEMAGAFAQRIEAKRLVLTHFSSRYEAALWKTANDEPDGNEEEEDDDMDIDPDADDDLDSTDDLVGEAKRAFTSGQVSAAYDYYEYEV